MNTIELEVGGEREQPCAPQAARSAAPATVSQSTRILGVVTGTLIAFKDNGRVPLVLFPGQPGTAAIGASTTLDLKGCHIGRQVALMFENGECRRPMIVGLIHDSQGWPVTDQPEAVEVDADGERLIVTAREQLTLRCGKASITLTKAGKVLISGSYVSSHSSGVIRIKGGSVQIN